MNGYDYLILARKFMNSIGEVTKITAVGGETNSKQPRNHSTY
jgi:hypothetical protein